MSLPSNELLPSSTLFPTAQVNYDEMILATVGLIGYWPLGDSSTTIADKSTNANNGTLKGTGYTQNEPSLLAGDPGSHAILFTGGEAEIEMPHIAPYSMTAEQSLEFWIKTGTYPVSAVTAGIFGQHENWNVNFFSSSARIYYVAKGVGGENPSAPTSSGDIYHVVATYDGKAKRLYLNGVLAVEEVITGTLATKSNPLYIHGTPYLEYRLQKAALYDKALSSTTVLNHYEAGIATGPKKRLVMLI